MQRQPSGSARVVMNSAVLALLVTGVASCTRPQSTRILSFFFDGVPAIDDTTRTDLSAAQLAAQREARNAARVEAQETAARQVVQTMHPPYAAQECESCHNFAQGKGSRTGGMPVLDFGGEAEKGILIMPIEQLCFQCHDDKTAEYAAQQKMVIHPPVEAGECLECHNPHRSPVPHLLIEANIQTLCFKCHDESLARGEDDHPELAATDSCMDCHNPHLSTGEFLLR